MLYLGMDQRDKGQPPLTCGSVTYISWSIDFALYHCYRLKLFLYIKTWRWPGVFVPLWALALVIDMVSSFHLLKKTVLSWEKEREKKWRIGKENQNQEGILASFKRPVYLKELPPVCMTKKMNIKKLMYRFAFLRKFWVVMREIIIMYVLWGNVYHRVSSFEDFELGI